VGKLRWKRKKKRGTEIAMYGFEGLAIRMTHRLTYQSLGSREESKKVSYS